MTAPTIRSTLPEWWAEYGDGYWQRDDGAVQVVRHAEEGETWFVAAQVHTFRKRYAEEMIGDYATLGEAIAGANHDVPLDAERAAKHRAYREGGPFPTN